MAWTRRELCLSCKQMRIGFVVLGVLLASPAFPQGIAAPSPRVATRHERAFKEGFAITSMAFSPDGSLLVVADTLGLMTVWDVKSGLQVTRFQDRGSRGGKVAFSSDDQWVALGAGWHLHLYKAGAWKEPYSALQMEGSVGGLAFSPDGKSLACAVDEVGITLWDPDTGKELRTFGGPTAFGSALAFRPDGRQLAAGSASGNSVRLWDVSSGMLA